MQSLLYHAFIAFAIQSLYLQCIHCLCHAITALQYNHCSAMHSLPLPCNHCSAMHPLPLPCNHCNCDAFIASAIQSLQRPCMHCLYHTFIACVMKPLLYNAFIAAAMQSLQLHPPCSHCKWKWVNGLCHAIHASAMHLLSLPWNHCKYITFITLLCNKSNISARKCSKLYLPAIFFSVQCNVCTCTFIYCVGMSWHFWIWHAITAPPIQSCPCHVIIASGV